MLEGMEAVAKGAGVNVLFCLSNNEDDGTSKGFNELIKAAKVKNVVVQFLSFEELLGQVRLLRPSNALVDVVDEFEHYLDRNDLLPRWKYLLDVVNCGKSMDELAKGAYICPNRGGPYSHARARFLGAYLNKAVVSVHEIDALLKCDAGGGVFEVVWSNIAGKAVEVTQRAQDLVKQINPIHESALAKDGLQIFLLGKSAKTHFRKDTPGDSSETTSISGTSLGR